LRDLHVVLNVGENGGLDEVAFFPDAIAAGDQLGLFFLSGVDVAHHFVELILVDLRALLGIFVEGIADGALLGTRGAFFDELVVGFFLYVETRTGAAALALVEEEREVRAFDGFVHVGVGEDNVGALAAELESDALEIGIGGGAHDEMADFGEPVKATLSTSMWRARAAPAVGHSRENVYYSWREPSFID